MNDEVRKFIFSEFNLKLNSVYLFNNSVIAYYYLSIYNEHIGGEISIQPGIVDKDKIIDGSKIKDGNISEAEMLSTFNCEVGLILVIEPSFIDIAIKQIEQYYSCYPIGKITSGHDKVVFTKNLAW